MKFLVLLALAAVASARPQFNVLQYHTPVITGSNPTQFPYATVPTNAVYPNTYSTFPNTYTNFPNLYTNAFTNTYNTYPYNFNPNTPLTYTHTVPYPQVHGTTTGNNKNVEHHGSAVVRTKRDADPSKTIAVDYPAVPYVNPGTFTNAYTNTFAFPNAHTNTFANAYTNTFAYPNAHTNTFSYPSSVTPYNAYVGGYNPFYTQHPNTHFVFKVDHDED